MNLPTQLQNLALIVSAVWLAGCLLLAVLTLVSATRPQIKGLWPLMFSEAGILLAGILPWFLPTPLFSLVLLVAAGRLGFESGMVNGGPAQGKAGLLGVALLSAIMIVAWCTPPNTTMVVTAVLAIGLAAAATISLRPSLQWIWHFLLFPALPFAAFTFAARWFEVPIAFVLALLIVEIFDSFALLGGRLFGKRLLAPKLSPRKTWEGLLTGLAAVFLVSGGLASALDLSMTTVAAISMVATAGAVVGDLTASAAKRRAGVKDYPALLAIQGGLLDIYDAWIVAAPLAAALAVLLSSSL